MRRSMICFSRSMPARSAHSPWQQAAAEFGEQVGLIGPQVLDQSRSRPARRGGRSPSSPEPPSRSRPRGRVRRCAAPRACAADVPGLPAGRCRRRADASVRPAPPAVTHARSPWVRATAMPTISSPTSATTAGWPARAAAITSATGNTGSRRTGHPALVPHLNRLVQIIVGEVTQSPNRHGHLLVGLVRVDRITQRLTRIGHGVLRISALTSAPVKRSGSTQTPSEDSDVAIPAAPRPHRGDRRRHHLRPHRRRPAAGRHHRPLPDHHQAQDRLRRSSRCSAPSPGRSSRSSAARPSTRSGSWSRPSAPTSSASGSTPG